MQRRLALALASMTAIAITACGGGDTTTVTSPEYLLRRDGVTGHCIAGYGDTTALIDCAREHTIEVAGTIDYPIDMRYPEGGIPIEFFNDCDAGFAEYVGTEPNRATPMPDHLRSTPVIPSGDAWSLGDHRVVCTVRSDLPWSGSVRDLGDLHPVRGPQLDVA